MNSRAFGKTGWPVNEIGLGWWEFRGSIQLDGRPDDEWLATIRRKVKQAPTD